MNTLIRLTIAVSVVMLCIGVAFAGFSSPEQAVAYRKGAMQVIKYHFGAVGAVIQGKAPYDKTAFETDAAIVAAVAGAAWKDSLVKGSADGATRLKASALGDPDGYAKMGKVFGEQADNLAAAARLGDMGEAKAAFGATAKSCKDCHGAYRK